MVISSWSNPLLKHYGTCMYLRLVVSEYSVDLLKPIAYHDGLTTVETIVCKLMVSLIYEGGGCA